MEKTDFKLEERILCSDETCIGLVGVDNKCKECDKVYNGNESLDFQSTDNLPEDTNTEDLQATDLHNEAYGSVAKNDKTEEETNSNFDSDQRICCSDENCIGIIGTNGICGICGNPALNK